MTDPERTQAPVAGHSELGALDLEALRWVVLTGAPRARRPAWPPRREANPIGTGPRRAHADGPPIDPRRETS